MQSGEIIKRLVADGWREVARKGSHVQFKPPVTAGRVTVPHPKREVPIGTLKSIEAVGTEAEVDRAKLYRTDP